jgi:hypothetical protein
MAAAVWFLLGIYLGKYTAGTNQRKLGISLNLTNLLLKHAENTLGLKFNAF